MTMVQGGRRGCEVVSDWNDTAEFRSTGHIYKKKKKI
jgi:hypothetical protein